MLVSYCNVESVLICSGRLIEGRRGELKKEEVR